MGQALSARQGEGVLFLTNNQNTMRLYEWIGAQGVPVTLSGEKIDAEQIERLAPRLVVSYNYSKLITKDVIDAMQGNIINLHTSLLPWNRGASPNVWSFLEGTPKGVTIHRIAEGLDTGDIIYQKELFLDPAAETFVSSYDKLHDAIVELFREHWEELYAGTYAARPQEGSGSYHSLKDFRELQAKISFAYTDLIEDVIRKYQAVR